MAEGRSRPGGELKRAMGGIRADRLKSQLTKGARINMRVTAPEKLEMEKMAKACGLTVTEYLTRLHYIAAERLGAKQRKR